MDLPIAFSINKVQGEQHPKYQLKRYRKYMKDDAGATQKYHWLNLLPQPKDPHINFHCGECGGLRARLVYCNKHCNVIVISMVQLFNSFVMFLLQGIVISYEQEFFKIRNNFSSLKGL